MKRLILVLGIVSGVWACDRASSSPSTPSPVPSPAPQPAVLRPISGYVYDTAFRPVAGASVQLVDGPQAGTMTTSDASGHFSYDGTFSMPVTLRATKDGYTTATAPAQALTDGRAYAGFQLGSVTPPVGIGGSYTLTITADSACTTLPDDVRTRTYRAAVIAATNTRAPAGTSFNGTVAGAQFAPHANLFWVGVFGDYVSTSTIGEGPSIVEQVGPNRYIAFMGEAGLSVGSADTSTISAPFKGTIEYCELKSAIGQYYDCSPELAAVREECTSNNGQLTLTRQ
jgi:Carboxypeptidase regulatory-like domain